MRFNSQKQGDEGVPAIDPAQAAERLKAGGDSLALDVREAEEWEEGHIPGAVWIPLGELPDRLHELPKDREIIVVCRSGGRSAKAAKFLLAAGFRAVNLRGGMLAWQGEVQQGDA